MKFKKIEIEVGNKIPKYVVDTIMGLNLSRLYKEFQSNDFFRLLDKNNNPIEFDKKSFLNLLTGLCNKVINNDGEITFNRLHIYKDKSLFGIKYICDDGTIMMSMHPFVPSNLN